MSTAVDALLAEGGAKPRTDAQRSVELLVAAARAALDEKGLDVTTRELAQRAGVGLGTLYRRIPSMDALFAAILSDTIDEMTARAIRALDDPDPWHGFAHFAEAYVQLRTSSCGLHAALSGPDHPSLAGQITRLREAVHALIRHARSEGVLRTDIDWQDIPFALATAVPSDHTIGLAPRDDQWRRNLRILLDGLRPPASAPAQRS